MYATEYGTECHWKHWQVQSERVYLYLHFASHTYVHLQCKPCSFNYNRNWQCKAKCQGGLVNRFLGLVDLCRQDTHTQIGLRMILDSSDTAANWIKIAMESGVRCGAYFQGTWTSGYVAYNWAVKASQRSDRLLTVLSKLDMIMCCVSLPIQIYYNLCGISNDGLERTCHLNSKKCGTLQKRRGWPLTNVSTDKINQSMKKTYFKDGLGALNWYYIREDKFPIWPIFVRWFGTFLLEVQRI